MIRSVSVKELEALVAADHPEWDRRAIEETAKEYAGMLDDRFDEPLRRYVREGEMAELRHGEFSLYLIRAMRKNCSYLQAVVLMDAYLKDELNGKALILRRW